MMFADSDVIPVSCWCGQAEEPQERKVLMLGLDGAGKSSILMGLTGSSTPFTPQSNKGFNVVYLTTAKVPMSFWESKHTVIIF